MLYELYTGRRNSMDPFDRVYRRLASGQRAVGNALEIQDENPAPPSKYLGEIERFSRVALFLSDYYVIQLQKSNTNLLRNVLSLSLTVNFYVYTFMFYILYQAVSLILVKLEVNWKMY